MKTFEPGGRTINKIRGDRSEASIQMMIRSFRKKLVGVTLLAAAAGCANATDLTGRQTSIGTLKASVSQLHAEKDKLEQQVAGMEAENRRLENRLGRSEQENGVLQARLEDNRRGFGGSTELGSGNAEALGSNDSSSGSAKAQTRKTRSTRKAPVAAIPGRIAPASPSDTPDRDDSGESEPIDLNSQGYLNSEGWQAGASVARSSWQSPNVVR